MSFIKFFKQALLGILVVFLVIIGLAFTKYKQISKAIENGSKMKPPVSAVTTQKVTYSSWPQMRRSSAVVKGSQSAMLSAEANGRVSKINIKEGTQVNAGDSLVELDTKVEVAQYEAAFAQAQLFDKMLLRQKTLRESNAISVEDLDKSKQNYETASKTAAALKAGIERRIIKAPYSGKVGVVRVTEGQYVTEGTAVITIENESNKYLSFSVSEQDLSKINTNTNVYIDKDNKTTNTVFKISSIDPNVSSETKSALAKVIISEDQAKNYLLNSYVSISLEIGNTDKVFKVPTASIQYAPYGNQVYVVKPMKYPDGIDYIGVVPKFITVISSNGDYSGISGGLEENEEIATSGVFKLYPNAAINIKNDDKIPTSENPTPDNT